MTRTRKDNPLKLALGTRGTRVVSEGSSYHHLPLPGGCRARRLGYKDERLPLNEARARAVAVCTHTDGPVTNESGSGRHLTNFVEHDSGRCYTRTFQQTLTINGYQTTDTFNYSVARGYCNRW